MQWRDLLSRRSTAGGSTTTPCFYRARQVLCPTNAYHRSTDGSIQTFARRIAVTSREPRRASRRSCGGTTSPSLSRPSLPRSTSSSTCASLPSLSAAAAAPAEGRSPPPATSLRSTCGSTKRGLGFAACGGSFCSATCSSCATSSRSLFGVWWRGVPLLRGGAGAAAAAALPWRRAGVPVRLAARCLANAMESARTSERPPAARGGPATVLRRASATESTRCNRPRRRAASMAIAAASSAAASASSTFAAEGAREMGAETVEGCARLRRWLLRSSTESTRCSFTPDTRRLQRQRSDGQAAAPAPALGAPLAVASLLVLERGSLRLARAGCARPQQHPTHRTASPTRDLL